MNYLKTIRTIVCCAMVVLMSVSCRQETPTTTPKQVFSWLIYKEGVSFNDLGSAIKHVKSISIFGNPPKSFIDECHRNGIEVYHAVGGNEKNLDTAEKITTVVDKYVADCKENGYDGIDLDFEHLAADFQPTYTTFLQLASQKLHADGKKLSHCVSFYPSVYEDNEAKMFYNPEVLAATCDVVRVMCYDMYFAPGIGNPELKDRDDCSGIGPTSNYPWTKEAMTFWRQHISKEKLLMALPAYSNDYAVTGGFKGRQIYQSVPDSVSGPLSSPIWLWHEKINMYVYDGTDGARHLFYASDARSTEAMLELADALDISQIGFWHYSSVNPQMWDVTDQWVKR